MKLVSILWKALNSLMLMLFAMAVAVEYMHPTSVLGMAVYGAAGVVCILAIRETNVTLLPPIVGVIALSWALTLAPQVVGKVSFDDVFILREMENKLVDVGRRMVGLWVVAFWMAMVTIVFLQQRAANR